MNAADAAEELQALAQAGWTITLWQEAPRARRGPLAAKGPTFVVEAGGVTGYDDDQAGEGATLADAVGALVDRLREAYPDDDAPEEHTTQGAPLAAVPDGLRERLDDKERETLRRLHVAAQDLRNWLVDGINAGDPTLLIAPGQSDHAWLARLDAALQESATRLDCDCDLIRFTIWNHEP